MPWPKGKKKPMSEETKQKIRDGRAKQEAAKVDQKRAITAKGVQSQPQAARPQMVELDEPALLFDLGLAIERHHAAVGQDLQALLLQLQHLQCKVLGITAEAVRMPADGRAHLLEAAANLDALAHQLAQFLATGRIEVA